MSGIIYFHVNKTNGKVYVGQTWREAKVRWNYGSGYKTSRYFYNAIKKYGWHGFDHLIVNEGDTQKKLDNLERVWIILLQATNPHYGYNRKTGGGRGKHIEATKDKIGERRRERPTKMEKLRQLPPNPNLHYWSEEEIEKVKQLWG